MKSESSSCCLHGFVLSVLLLLLVASARAQQAPSARTDPIEAAALNKVFVNLGLMVQFPWTTQDPCTGGAVNGISLDDNPNFNPGIKCDCTDQNNTVCHVIRLKIYALNVVGLIPEELRNLTWLTTLDLRQNYLTGPLPSFLGELTAMQFMSLGINALSGSVPKELGNLTNLISLGFGNNYLNGSLPSELGNLVKLEQLYIDSAGLSGPLPASFSKLTRMKILWASDNDFTGKIPDYIGSWTNLTELRFQGNSFQGPLPTTLSNLVQLTSLRLGDIVNGSSSLSFISNMTSLNTLVLRSCRISDSLASINFSQFPNLNLLDLSFNDITGPIPQALLDMNSLYFLFLGNNSLSGSLPSSIRTSCEVLDFSYNQLSGNIPSWASQKKLQLNLVANNFVIDYSNNSLLPTGLECLQRNTPCFLGRPQSSSFAVDCGSSRSLSGADNSMYQPDNASLGPASYYVTGAPTWGVSNVGRFMDASDGSYIIYSSARQYQNTSDSELFQTARMSPSSLRYYGIGLENGNYTVTLQLEYEFENSQTWKSLGRRIFDIYIQGERKEQNFDIRKADGVEYFGTAVRKQYVVPVTANFLEIHLFWAGKGTCCIPNQGYYGPAISALSATRNAGEKKRSTETGVIIGVLVGAAVLGLVVLAGLYLWRQKRINVSSEQQGTGRLNLNWPTCLDICLGIARGLAYLHEESSIRVVHRDIKASNVLLDVNLNPKISDFGLAKLYDDKKTHVSTKVAGTFGYLAPEYAMRGRMTEKVDVFAFGVVTLEILAGRPNYDQSLDEDRAYLLEWVWTLYKKNQPLQVVDPRIANFNSEEALRAIRVGLLCIQSSPHERPSMSRVVSMLAGDIEVIEAVSIPSYITEWQSSSGPRVATTHTGSPFLSSVIDEGR